MRELDTEMLRMTSSFACSGFELTPRSMLLAPCL